jgi:PsbP
MNKMSDNYHRATLITLISLSILFSALSYQIPSANAQNNSNNSNTAGLFPTLTPEQMQELGLNGTSFDVFVKHRIDAMNAAKIPVDYTALDPSKLLNGVNSCASPAGKAFVQTLCDFTIALVYELCLAIPDHLSDICVTPSINSYLKDRNLVDGQTDKLAWQFLLHRNEITANPSENAKKSTETITNMTTAGQAQTLSSSSPPSSPSTPVSTTNNTNLNIAREQYLSAWTNSGFHSQFETFVNSTDGYGIYQEHKSNIFRPGEDIILYVEPVGFSHVPVNINNTKLYLMNLTASIILSDTQGNILFGRENIPIASIVSHTQNTEMFARLRVGQSSPFPPGGYVISYVVTDVPSGKSFKIVKNITVTSSGVNGGMSSAVNGTSSLGTTSSPASNNTSASPPISPPTITTSTPAGWHSYTNSTFGISLLYPPDWMQSPVGQPDGTDNTAYYIMNFVPPISQDPTADTILGVGIDNTTRQSTPSLNQYAFDTINSYRSAANVTDFKVIKAGTNITMGGHPGYILYYTKKVQPNPAPRTYLEAGTIADGTIYYIQVGSAMSEKQFTDIMFPQVMQIIKSFKILHPITLQSEQQQSETSQQEVQQQQIPGIIP